MIAHTAPAVHSQASLVIWLRCHACHRSYFNAGAPGPRPCPACAGRRLQPTALCDLAYEAEPAGMLRHGEV
jgi:hypothetical protein